jgi:tRNA uridine 5-carboxymethylaminomethyl modification enzyme
MPTTWAKLLGRPEVDRDRLVASVPVLGELEPEDRDIVLGELRYDGYRARAQRERDRVHKLRQVKIPVHLDMRAIGGLSREAVEELERVKPRTLAEAEGLGAMTPAAIAILAGRIMALGRTGGG